MKRSRATDQQLQEHAESLARAAGLILIVFIVGVFGFQLVGPDDTTTLDAIFMTVITLTTVGYGETVEVSRTPEGTIFTTMLLLAGVGSFVYFFSNLTAFMVEGSLDRLLWRRRMKRAIDRLDQHYIVCGAGATGAHIIKELIATKRPFVCVDTSEETVRALFEEFAIEFPAVFGDATDDETLREAGIERARGLTACIASDKDNLIVTVSARLLNPDLRIVSRCIEERVKPKVRQAGAAAVVSPNMIGGLRMVSELVRPTVVSFLDIMLRDEKNLRVEEFSIVADTSLANTTVGELRRQKISDLLVVAVSHADGSWDYNPNDDAKLTPGMGLIYMGSPQARVALEKIASQG